LDTHIIQFPGIVWWPGKVATEVCRTLEAFARGIRFPLTSEAVDIIEQLVIATTPTNGSGIVPVVLIGTGIVVYDNGVHEDVHDNGNIPSLTFVGFPGCQHMAKNVPGWTYEASPGGQSFRLVLQQRPELIESFDGEILQPLLKPVPFY